MLECSFNGNIALVHDTYGRWLRAVARGNEFGTLVYFLYFKLINYRSGIYYIKLEDMITGGERVFTPGSNPLSPGFTLVTLSLVPGEKTGSKNTGLNISPGWCYQPGLKRLAPVVTLLYSFLHCF